MCTGTAPPNVSGLFTVSVQWQINGAEFTNATLEGVNVSNNGSVATLNFSFLNNNHEKDYICLATLNVADVPMARNSSTTYTFMVLSKFSIIVTFIYKPDLLFKSILNQLCISM